MELRQHTWKRHFSGAVAGVRRIAIERPIEVWRLSESGEISGAEPSENELEGVRMSLEKEDARRESHEKQSWGRAS